MTPPPLFPLRLFFLPLSVGVTHTSNMQDLEAHFKAKGKEVTHETIEEFAWETLNSGKVRQQGKAVRSELSWVCVLSLPSRKPKERLKVAWLGGRVVVGCTLVVLASF